MKITHIFHSGFMIETEHSTLLFDWYKGTLPEIRADRKLYVCCSHSHGDHYSPQIWELRKSHPDVIYILDEGIPDIESHPEASVITVRPRQRYVISGKTEAGENPLLYEGPADQYPDGNLIPAEDPAGLSMITLESTDMGVAFYIETEGKRIYHAGDLNVWFWFDEPMEDNIASEKKCREEMQYLADIIRKEGPGLFDGKKAQPLIDIAFVPLDPRLLEDAPRCIAAFMETLGASCVFPMHYWGRIEETKEHLANERIKKYADILYFDDIKEVL